jgi:tetratricopeptide (TPR) repeat protein
MSRIFAMLGAALALALGTARAAAPAAPGEDLFKWGEYDSLIRLLEPAALRSGEARTHGDSLARAKSLLFLGVAFCATGKPERADEAFSRAVELDPQVELDRFYVTEEIANRFQATALRALRKHSAARPSEAIAPGPPPAKAAAPPAAFAPEPRHGWLWLGMGAAAVAAAAGGGYYLFHAGHGGGTRENVTYIDLSRP